MKSGVGPEDSFRLAGGVARDNATRGQVVRVSNCTVEKRACTGGQGHESEAPDARLQLRGLWDGLALRFKDRFCRNFLRQRLRYCV